MAFLPRVTLRKYWPWLGLLIGLWFAVPFALGLPIADRLDGRYFDYLENKRDALVRDDPEKDPVALVAIDDETFQATSQDPRELYATAIERILADDPRVLAIDLVFEDRDRASVGARHALEELSKRATVQPAVATSVLSTIDPDTRLVKALTGKPTVAVFFATEAPDGKDDFSRLPPDWRSNARGCATLHRAREFNKLQLDMPDVVSAIAMGGNAYLPPDGDGIVREYPLVTRLGSCDDCVYPSLALAAAKAYAYSADSGEFDVPGAQKYDDLECVGDTLTFLSVGSYAQIPFNRIGEIAIDFRRGFDQTFPNWVPIRDVVDGKVKPGRFKDKAVFLGEKSSFEDHFATPTDPLFPGVGVHALVAHSLLTNQFLHRSFKTEVAWEPLAMLLCGLAVTILFLTSDPGGWPMAAAVLLPIIGHLLSFEFLTGRPLLGIHLFHGGEMVDALMPGIAGALALLACTGARFVVEREARQQSERELGRFLSPSVVDIALKKPELLLPARKEITILFSDIRGFTTTAEGMTPEALVALLDQYLTKMTDIVFQHRGTLDKYIGDAVMALYGAPLEYEDHPVMACRSALEMFRALAKLQEQWKAEGRPVLKIGVGINTGVVSVGRMGSSAKSEYTCIGDEVNFASRVEGLTKAYGVHILVGENTRNRAGDDLVFRDIGPVRVKGKKKSVRVYELVGTRAEIPDVRWIATFEQAMERFRARDWEGTDELLKKAIAERGGDDPPSAAVMVWTRIFRQHPPEEDWDGTIERREK